MTSDSSLHRPTESLILPNKRRFIPFKIPNFHTQLRHYISTADPDRIYVVVDRIVWAIHISTQCSENIAVIPFEPRCLAAGFGWIAVGGPDNGECAFIKIGGGGSQVRGQTTSQTHSDVDSALPLDLEPSTSLSSPRTSPSSSATASRRSGRRLLPEIELHKFGGTIVNSVTIHRFPGNGQTVSDEDVVIFSNNDRTVTVYSLTRAKVLKVLQHPTCMNYASISPDHRLLAAVGDENRAYFYEITRDLEGLITTEAGEKLAALEWDLAQCVEMDIGLRVDDACCFTIAFSPSSHLCAIGSQSGIITVLDVEMIHKTASDEPTDLPVMCQFPASRSCPEGGAVRCMTFSPEPWDLLVWLEGHGRAGIADVRQSFLRRQIIHLDVNDPQLQEVRLGPKTDGYDSPSLEDDDLEVSPRVGLDVDDIPNERDGPEAERSSLREALISDLTERERLIMEFLNTARWTSRLEEGLTERPERPPRATLHPLPATRSRQHGATDGAARPSRPGSPPYPHESSELSRSSHVARTHPPRRQSSVVLSQSSRLSEARGSNSDHQPSLTLSYTASPSEFRSNASDTTSRFAEPDSAIHEPAMLPEMRAPPSPPATGLDLGLSPEALRILARSRSTPRRPEQGQSGGERRYDTSRLSNYEIRANVAAERLRRQRQIANEVHNRSFEREQRHRQQLLGFEQTHSPRWIRNIINDLPDRSLVPGPGAEEPDSTAGVGFGADGRTLYIATLEGIFEFSLNVHDRKTFPVFSYR
ncbi:hypothetical protein N7523_009811 [Penicillium sp. IBT 18751x]|nr:hypothetical protein N7523_009811 [Penicillium sp. IBT 18751x]